MSSVTELMSRIYEFIIYPLIGLLAVAALAVFLWGVAQFILHAGEDEGRETGKKHMLWGIIGLFIILSVIGILEVITNTFGITLPKLPKI